ncbi:YcnI family copper-binding membrane protein [Streptomyces tubercidicus]|uniref:YcnI family copper-binding membrane protein n=1 Tax=Streptomyces tubercidicus TaxID=47759 RepID=UPI003466E7F0
MRSVHHAPLLIPYFTNWRTALFRKMLIPARLLLPATAAGAAVLIAAGPASAHVTVQPGTAEKGGVGTVAFQVPNEDDTSATTKVEVYLDPDTPLSLVSTRPVPGWKVRLEKRKPAKPESGHGRLTEAVSKITWSGGTIAPQQFQRFDVVLGTLPTDTDTLVFKAVQTYADGEVVRWIEDSSGARKPQHPAPVLRLTAPQDGGGHQHGSGHGNDPAPQSPAPSPSTAPASGLASDGTAREIGTTGLLIALAALALGSFALFLALNATGRRVSARSSRTG